jgi:hypothetical protein
MSYDLSEHRHRFAIWAAARASQRGFTTVENLRNALESSDIREVLETPEALQLSSGTFDAFHRSWCSAICLTLSTRHVDGVTYGRAAKLVAVYLKATVVMGGNWDTPFGRTMHPPIDRILLQRLASCETIDSPHKRSWSAISWTKLDEEAYYSLIGELREALPVGAPFWIIEEH